MEHRKAPVGRPGDVDLARWVERDRRGHRLRASGEISRIEELPAAIVEFADEAAVSRKCWGYALHRAQSRKVGGIGFAGYRGIARGIHRDPIRDVEPRPAKISGID